MDAHYARLEAQESFSLGAAPNDGDDGLETTPTAHLTSNGKGKAVDGVDSEDEMEESVQVQGGEDVMVLGESKSLGE